jgi:hypothetical protein
MIDPFFDAHRVVIVPLTELLLLQLDAARGDDDAYYLMQIVIAMIQQVINAPDDQPATCACCQSRIRPATGEPTAGVSFLVCQPCGFTPEGLNAAVARTMQCWPNLQCLQQVDRLGGTA